MRFSAAIIDERSRRPAEARAPAGTALLARSVFLPQLRNAGRFSLSARCFGRWQASVMRRRFGPVVGRPNVAGRSR
ncbi:hypothetical protein BG36_06135 [Aquamicrobium defluvii]|uniref:Uncharacterized protein n=1 Tax=Aquamicrobium defluvii TaxID=69279 RepID=A0A011UL97_9HYPH|nr:hypothetical protein BG36_06135 [Aquamicrobium defluvii]